MINKRKKKYPIGKSEDLKEGIYGVTKEKRKKKKAKIQTSSKAEKKVPSKPLFETKINSAIKKVRIKDKAKKPEKKTKVKLPSVPKLKVDYKGSSLPKEAEGLQLDNVVGMPISLLKKLSKSTTLKTKELSQLMLDLTPFLLSYDLASKYVQTTLKDGLNIEVDMDVSTLEVIKDISKLEIITHFVNTLKLPKEYKDRFINSFIDKLAEASHVKMEKVAKGDSISKQIQELHGVLVKRSEQTPKQLERKRQQAIKRQRKDGNEP